MCRRFGIGAVDHRGDLGVEFPMMQISSELCRQDERPDMTLASSKDDSLGDVRRTPFERELDRNRVGLFPADHDQRVVQPADEFVGALNGRMSYQQVAGRIRSVVGV